LAGIASHSAVIASEARKKGMTNGKEKRKNREA
jgi:hypothetical protein